MGEGKHGRVIAAVLGGALLGGFTAVPSCDAVILLLPFLGAEVCAVIGLLGGAAAGWAATG
jgi:hypothetical protein